MSKPERREFSRVEIHLDAELRSGGVQYPRTRTLDLSAIGTRVETSLLLPVGAPCEVVLWFDDAAVPDGMRIWVEGRVARVADGELGIEFTGIDPDSYEHLRTLLLFHADDPEPVERELVEHLGIRRRGA